MYGDLSHGSIRVTDKARSWGARIREVQEYQSLESRPFHSANKAIAYTVTIKHTCIHSTHACTDRLLWTIHPPLSCPEPESAKPNWVTYRSMGVYSGTSLLQTLGGLGLAVLIREVSWLQTLWPRPSLCLGPRKTVLNEEVSTLQRCPQKGGSTALSRNWSSWSYNLQTMANQERGRLDQGDYHAWLHQWIPTKSSDKIQAWAKSLLKI